ncbi:hypothetical protein [Calothrix sp. 336/3]|uniref:hypothetical protein n=1 Tax=Calothrix sp. 336/3 TaxID=1337936 RepID=UPI0004E32DBF|nr:hypothetical protein [Calothrix sp. 336/3]AKG20173.1 hypothetical protein IJ00_01600 [Calothrix sp. 336/3]
MESSSSLVTEFEQLFRQKLRLNNCRLQKKIQENSYEITTPAKDIFLMSWSDFPDIKLVYQPVGIRTKQTVVYERAIRDHIIFCVNSVQNKSQHSLMT